MGKMFSNYRWMLHYKREYEYGPCVVVFVNSVKEAREYIETGPFNGPPGQKTGIWLMFIDLDTNEVCSVAQWDSGFDGWNPHSLTDAKLLLTILEQESA